MGDALHLAKHCCTNFLWRQKFDLSIQLQLNQWLLVIPLNQDKRQALALLLDSLVCHLLPQNPLHIKEGVPNILRCLDFSAFAHQALAGLQVGHVAGHCVPTLVILQHTNFSVLPDRHAGIGGAQVNPQNWRGVICRCVSAVS
mmetsp:Transcript_33364/g.53786  ORF Transcript_33364/g.53786 Transcript_33364/m.53786 type:complete len:143 (+) Transcript_33364:1457-1885(+)